MTREDFIELINDGQWKKAIAEYDRLKSLNAKAYDYGYAAGFDRAMKKIDELLDAKIAEAEKEAKGKKEGSMIGFRVYGKPVPKQSFKVGKDGHGYTPAHIKAWQAQVAGDAQVAMQGEDILEGELAVSLVFYLPDKRRRDLDNLSKAVLDAMNKIVYADDQQITALKIVKIYGGIAPGVDVQVKEPYEMIPHIYQYQDDTDNEYLAGLA